MKSQIQVLLFFLIISLGYSQPRLSFDLGLGIYQPNLTGYDDNNTFPSSNALNRNVLFNWGVYYEFFYNARFGMSTLTSIDSEDSENFILGNQSSADFNRRITYRFFPIETFFRLRPRIELNFTLMPIWGRSVISLVTNPPQQMEDWESFLTLFNDDDVGLSEMKASDNMASNWFGYGSMLGFRYYLTSRMAIDFKSGFMNNSYDETRWYLREKKVTGPKMKIDGLPIFTLKILYGIR